MTVKRVYCLSIARLFSYSLLSFYFICRYGDRGSFGALEGKESLCFYGFPIGQWKVCFPAEEVPPEFPEPTLGINFARDGMEKKDWLALVAVHSDSWLLAVAFYFGARCGFDKADRKRLFGMINNLPTLFEVVTGVAEKQLKEKRAIANHSSNKFKFTSKIKYSKAPVKEEDEGLADDEDDFVLGETLCAKCEDTCASDEFWIRCGICERWFHGKCVKITPAKAKHMKHVDLFKCRSCLNQGSCT